MRNLLLFLCCMGVLVGGCSHAAAPPATGAAAPREEPAVPARPPAVTRVDPFAGTAGAVAKDPGFVALEQELQRAKHELGTRGNPAPHFIAYAVYEQHRIDIAAQYGALVQSSDNRGRVLDVDVRVGDPKLDSTHVLRGEEDYGYGGMISLPLEADADAIRAVAWDETDKRYKAAVERFMQVKTQQQVKAKEEDTSDDFSREKPVTFVEAPATIALDVAAWENRIRALSARFRAAPELHDATVRLEAGSANRWLTNSEGSSVQTGSTHVRVFMEANTRADDGMELRRYETFDAELPSGLPDDATMAAKADEMIADLMALRSAPLAEPFAGPAILEGKAAGVFFHEIFGHRVEGHRQKREEEGQTFAKKVGSAIMPEFISVYDDPTLKQLGGQDLNGFYRFDDEAVPAQRASLVEQGVLRGFLMGRSPTRGFDRSNGHGRRQPGQDVVARQANLVVQPSTAVSTTSLRRRLRDEARRQGRPYGLLFKDISGGFTFTRRDTPQAFKVKPILVYRVWVDGRPDELIRGADIVGTPLASLGRILAAGDDYATFNGSCGAESGMVPVSATSPSLLLQQIEIERKEKGDEQPPLLAAPDSPPVSGAAAPDDAVVRRALDLEMKRAMTELRVPGEAAPYYLAYTVDDGDLAIANATFGALTDNDRFRYRMLHTNIRVGDQSFDNGNAQAGFGFGGGVGNANLSIEDDLASLRRDLWLRTDEAYKHALQMLAMKKAAATSQAKGKDDDVPDFSTEPPAQTVTAAPVTAIDSAALGAIARQLSGLFREYPQIASSRVTAMQLLSRRRLLTSEGSWADQRRSILRIAVTARTQAGDGMDLSDVVVFSALATEGLPPLEKMQTAVRKMAERLQAQRSAVRPDNGTATVLFEDTAAAQLVKQLLGDEISGTPPPRTMGRGGRGQTSEFLGRIGQRVTATMLSAVDDPTLEAGPGGVPLFGSYRADDEGVPAQRVQVLQDGVLRALLMSRTPSKDIARSNGHARTGGFGDPRAQIGNLIVSARGGLARPALLAKAAKLAKSKDEPLYVVRLLSDAGTLGADIGDSSAMMRMFMFGGGGAAPQIPLAAYRVEGNEEVPLRGFTLEGLRPQSLKDVVAAGKDPSVLNFFGAFSGATLPCSVVSPALLFAGVEVREQSAKDDKLPLYPHPFFAQAQGPAAR